MKIAKACLLTLLLILLFGQPHTARAHATLLRSEPADGTVFTTAPQVVRLWFSEAISPKFSTAQILNEDGRSLTDITISTDPLEPTLMLIQLPTLADGAYSILWKVLSTRDGHFTQGLVVFGVGEQADLGQVVVAPETTAVPWPEVLLRWLHFTFLLSLVGGLAILTFVLNGPNQLDMWPQAHSRLGRWVRLCIGLLLLLGAAWAVWQGYSLQQNNLLGASLPLATWQWLSQTRLGVLWWARQAVLVVLLVLAGGKRPFSPHIPLLLGLLLLLLQSLTSHAAALTSHVTLALVADMLHLTGASFWVGGLLALLIGLLPTVYQQPAQAKSLLQVGWRPFGRFAAMSVGLLLITGLYSLGRQAVSLDALLLTPYGQTVLVKTGFMLAAGFVGGLNSMLLHPQVAGVIGRLLRRPSGWTPFSLARLPRLLLAESTLGLSIILLTGLLTASPTAQGREFQPTEIIPSTLSQTVADMFVTLTIKPNQPGQNVITVRAVSQRKPAPAEIVRVIVRLNYQEQDLGLVSLDAEEIEPGYYLIGGNQLNLSGLWHMDVVVRRDGLEDSVAQFDWTVGSAGETRPVLVSNYPWQPLLTSAAAFFIFLLLAGVALTRRSHRSPILPQSLVSFTNSFIVQQEIGD
ncbi:MAG: copper resistance protein CopC/CopD [Ardenticatenaceae bacterium]|nr:copper resistance protein CopC/CopD [Ardenticatenaceae bacterium]